jgi:DNA modification methylase
MSVTLYLQHGDCVQVLGEHPEGSVGAVVCDPPYELSFMGKGWDGTGVAYDPVLWSHLYRVLVPGGVVKAFSATRTFHRMAAAMRDAGFTKVGVEAWAYGSGFPKSLNIGKALDRAAGVEGGRDPFTYLPATEAARTWDGWGTALKPSWEPVLVGRKPLS